MADLKYIEKLISLCFKDEHLVPQDKNEFLFILNKIDNWGLAEKEISQMRVSAFVYYVLKKKGLTRVLPIQFMFSLRSNYYTNLFYNLRGIEQIQYILKILEREEIVSILLKGASYIKTIYPNPALRGFCDLDLLVKKEDLNTVHTILMKQGYKLFEKNKLDYYCENKIMIDIHWNILQFSQEDLVTIWQNCPRVDFGGIKSFVLSPQDMLLYLIYHTMFMHNQMDIQAFLDVARIIKTYSQKLDWMLILKKMKRYNLEIPSYLFLRQAKNEVKADVPQEVLEELSPKGVYLLVSKLYRIYLNNFSSQDISHLFNVLISRGFTKLKFLWLLIFPTKRFLLEYAGFGHYLLRYPFFLRPTFTIKRAITLGWHLLTHYWQKRSLLSEKR